MSQLTSHLVEPSAYADSSSRVGTVRNTSRITEEMKGMTMIASTMPAVSMPMPIGGPWNSAPTSRSEEHTSELQSLMRISYAVFCLKKKKEQDREPEPKKNK